MAQLLIYCTVVRDLTALGAFPPQRCSERKAPRLRSSVWHPKPDRVDQTIATVDVHHIFASEGGRVSSSVYLHQNNEFRGK